ncbi:PLP-dependent aminotransferase family protein [Amnibacterium flavum]|uniref:PLP-dependent aminotransferase family protein n=1 Tax=Amnibacterium flavum TaxID=2173173 RepID=A0A2V1HY11_9MICO|nr:PLP-dependent aminotransferase family protein [Amnibacterium flavum]PVZ95284.1 PLP-dependent aminotransferase family protein [Amnibacterium flavum]
MVRTVSPQQLADLLAGWRDGDGAGYAVLAARIRLLAIDGRIPAGSRLPSERELADRLGVSRTTIGAALDELRASGYVETRRGSGSIIRIPGTHAHRHGSLGPLGPRLDFTTASAGATPGFQWAAERAVSALPSVLGGPGYELIGLPQLREALAERYTARGLPTRPTQIMVTSGAQAAITLAARVLLGRGDRAVVESPGYPHAYEALRLAGARLIPLAVDATHGWKADEAVELIRGVAPKVAYLMPDFHNPTARTMPETTRERIARAARESGSTLLIDETTGELDIDRGRRAPFAAVVPAGTSVVTIGSASKTMWGGLRVGWLRASEDVIAELAIARPHGDLGTAVLDQLIVTELLADLDAILEHRRAEHLIARDALAAALAERLPSWRMPRVDGGLAAWVHFDRPVSSQLAIGARDRGLRIPAGPWFGLDGAYERFIRIPFGPGPEAVRNAVDILAEVWADVADAPVSSETSSLSAVV